jgi:pimeloyl-ACP methyl ester carboxylesterase
MPLAERDGAWLHWRGAGPADGEAVLMIMGLGGSGRMWWRLEPHLADRWWLLLIDNRGTGDSDRVSGPLTMAGMAADAVAVLDAAGVDSAHVVGASMGGMIAQVFAARHKVRTKTLAIIFSSNNQPLLPPPGAKQLLAILQKPKNATREAIVENAIRVTRITGSPGYPAPDERIRAEAIEGYDRSYYPAGVGRHFAAILGSGSLLGYDRQISVPTVVIHGKADRLMRPFGGRAVAKAIKGARLVLFDGMGHDLPRELWDDIVGELKTTFAESR